MERFVRGSISALTEGSGEAVTEDLPDRFEQPLLVGEGGMGEVFRAHDRVLGRLVALKAVHLRWQSRDELRQRLLDEARTLSNVEHPAICRIHDYIEGATRDYLVLEWVEGTTLERWRAAEGAGASTADLDAIALELISGLAAAHAVGVVHRDLKPQNVMVTPEGRPRLLDFGIARAAEAVDRRMAQDAAESSPPSAAAPATSGRPSSARTEPGTILGTLGYMSPEQAGGASVGLPADTFSLGLLLQELWTGRAARPANCTLEQVREGLRSVPQGLDSDRAELVHRCCNLDPEQRPTVDEVHAHLRRILGKPARRRVRALIAGVCALALAGGVKYSVDLQEQRDVALDARTEADLRRSMSDDLIVFMVRDLRVQLEQAGRLDLLLPASVQVTEYFERLPEEDSTPNERALRCRAFTQLGLVHLGTGDLESAQRVFGEARRAGESLLGTHWSDSESAESDLLFDLAQVDFFMGYVHFDRGELDAAHAEFARYLERARGGRAAFPHDLRWASEERMALSNLGSLDLENGALGAAEERFARLAADWEATCAGADSAADDVREWADALSLWASVAAARGDYDRAAHRYRRELDVRGRLISLELEDVHRLAIAHNNLAGALQAQGDVDGAFERCLQSGELSLELVTHDASNTDWRRTHAIHASTRGNLLALRGERDEGLPWAREARDAFAQLCELDPTNADWREQLEIAESVVASLSAD
ncbi:MAG: serine/threonine-protein kinase [Planctomycetota bacterium]|jgi:tetratricopeptide (TPR) repeat protein